MVLLSFFRILCDLVTRGVDPNSVDGSAWTTLHHAAAYGQVNSINATFAMRPDVNVNAQDHQLWSPLIVAAGGFFF